MTPIQTALVEASAHGFGASPTAWAVIREYTERIVWKQAIVPPSDREDMVQDIMVKVGRHATAATTPGPRWLGRLAHNVQIDHLRLKAALRETTFGDNYACLAYEPHPLTPDEAEQRLMAVVSAVRAAVARETHPFRRLHMQAALERALVGRFDNVSNIRAKIGREGSVAAIHQWTRRGKAPLVELLVALSLHAEIATPELVEALDMLRDLVGHERADAGKPRPRLKLVAA